jgi:hypothetical protein
MTALLAVMVVAVVAVVVAYPLFKPGPQAPPDPVGPAARIAALEERKLQIYAAIRELGFDYRTDKLEEADYELEAERLKAEAVSVVRQIDELGKQPPRGPDELEAEIAAFRRTLTGDTDAGATQADAAPREAPAGAAAVFCTQCGAAARADDRFCSSCGNPLRTS